MKLLKATLDAIVFEIPDAGAAHEQNICLDAGYDFEDCRDELKARGLTAHIVPRDKEARLIKAERERPVGYRARRWVVERTHSWMNRFRRLLIRWEKKVKNYLGFCQLACGLMCSHRLPLSG